MECNACEEDLVARGRNRKTGELGAMNGLESCNLSRNAEEKVYLCFLKAWLEAGSLCREIIRGFRKILHWSFLKDTYYCYLLKHAYCAI